MKTTKSRKRGAPAHLKRIIARAKQIRKANPRKKWTTCVKEASK